MYVPQWGNMTVENVTFQTNNVIGNFNYPPNVPAYKPIMKFLLNFPLNKAFTNCPSVLYQNYLREFLSTAVVYDPSLSTDETEQSPLREFLIKFLGPEASESLPQNRKKPISKKAPRETKATPPLSQWRVLRNPTQSPRGTRKSQPLPEGTTTNPKDSGGNVQPTDKRFPFTASNEGMAKTMPRLEGPLGDKDLEGNKPHADMEPINPTITDPSGTGIEYQAQHEEAVVSYADPRASVEGYYEENIANRDQTDKLVEASMSSLKKSRIATSDLYKGLNIIIELLKDIKNAVKDDHVLNKKVIKATEAYTKNSSALTKLLNLLKNFDF
ncbi:hypothetical protein Tco_0169199 [Tanacetum coccineum]